MYGVYLTTPKLPGVYFQKETGKTQTEGVTTTTYLPIIEKSIVVERKEDTQQSPMDISSFSGERETPPTTKAEDIETTVYLASSQVVDSGSQGVTARQEHVIKWAKDYERVYTPINSSNVVAAAMEYCEKHKVKSARVDEVTAIFKRYAKIPPEHLSHPEPAEAFQ
jgi:hypothetical protein